MDALKALETYDRLFEVKLQIVQPKQASLDNTVRGDQFYITFKQIRDVRPDENSHAVLSNAILNAVRRYVEENFDRYPPEFLFRISMPGQGTIFGLQKERSVRRGFTIAELLDGSARLDEFFEALANHLNSGQEFHPLDSLNIKLYIWKPEKKGGVRGKVGHLGLKQALQRKNKSRNNARGGHIIFHQLSHVAVVQPGVCGVQELDQFQDYFTQDGFKIVVFTDVNQWYYNRKDITDYQDVLYLLYEDQPGAEYAHVQPVMNGKGWLGTCFICVKCEKGYNQEDYTHQKCEGDNCPACERTQRKCPDYAADKKRTHDYRSCQRRFYGPSCLEAYSAVQGKTRKSVCSRRKRCLSCFSDYRVHPKQAHKCEHLTFLAVNSTCTKPSLFHAAYYLRRSETGQRRNPQYSGYYGVARTDRLTRSLRRERGKEKNSPVFCPLRN